jgi:uncharacterized Zn-finger protein
MNAPLEKTLTATALTVTAADLPLHCPPKGVQLWSGHPRVFLDVLKTVELSCPYCGT